MATIRLSHAALGNMVAKNAGGMINVASVAAFVQRAGSVSYGATKHWMTAFTEGLYLELKSVQSAVKVQALCPGFTLYGVSRNTGRGAAEALRRPRFGCSRSLWWTSR